MDSSTIVRQFKRFNLNLRPETLRKILELNLDNQQMEKICDQFQKMGFDSKILEVGDIENLLSMGKTNNILQMLRHRENTSIMIIDPFQNDRKYKLHSSYTDKIRISTQRLERMVQQLRGNDFKMVEKKIQITEIGSIFGSLQDQVTICGQLNQLADKTYILSDGKFTVKLQMENGCKQKIEKQNYLINVGHIVLVNGKWDESISAFQVFQIQQPQLQKTNKDNKNQVDLRFALEEDQFGTLQRLQELMNQQINFDKITLQQQIIMEYFPLSIQQNKQTTTNWWFISEFDMTNSNTLLKLQSLQSQIEENIHQIIIPSGIFFLGQFFKSRQQIRNNILGQDILKVLVKIDALLQGCWMFFMPSFDDPIDYHSLPRLGLPLEFIFGTHQIPYKMHSLSNPNKISLCGTKLQVIRNDISREMWKNHLIEVKELNPELICNTLLSQGYFDNPFGLQQITKWQHNDSLAISSRTQLIVLADSTLSQFKFDSPTHFFANPGNFTSKGEFIIIQIEDRSIVNIELCKISVS